VVNTDHKLNKNIVITLYCKLEIVQRYGLETARLLIYISCSLVVLHKVQWTMKWVYLYLGMLCFGQNVGYESHRCTVHFVKSLQLLTNKCTYITFT